MFIAPLLTAQPALQRSAMFPAMTAPVEHRFAPLERAEPFCSRAFYKHFAPTGRRKRLKGQKHHLAQQYVRLAHALEQNDEKYRSLLFFLRAVLSAPRDACIREEARAAVRRHRGFADRAA